MARQIWCDDIKAVAREVSAGQHPDGMVQAGAVYEDNSRLVVDVLAVAGVNKGGLSIDSQAHGEPSLAFGCCPEAAVQVFDQVVRIFQSNR